jgi:2-keto-4-pentenoate hydratase
MDAGGRMDAAARYLLERRAGAPRERAFPAELAPRDETEAYAIQRAVLRQLGAGIGGWKASLNNATEGQSAPLLAATVLDSPARLTPDRTATRGTREFGIEPEVAFRLGSGLPARADGAAHSRVAVIDAIGAAHPVIEICVCRFAKFSDAPGLDRLADNIINEALIVGAPRPDWRKLDIARLPLRVRVNGAEVHSGRGGHPLGDPLAPVVWLANHLNARGLALEAGQIVTTGSCNGIRFVDAGGRVDVEFGGLGAVNVEF